MSAYALNEVARLSRTGSWVARLLAMGPEAQDEENARVEDWICERMRQEGLYVGEAERIVRQVWPLFLERKAFGRWLRRHKGVNIVVPETAEWAADMGAMDMMYVGRDEMVAARLFLEMMDRGEAVPFEYRKDPVTEVPEEVRREQVRIVEDRRRWDEERKGKLEETDEDLDRMLKEAVEEMGRILREYGRMKENGESVALEKSGDEKLTEEQEAKLEKLMERELTEEEIDSAEGFHEIIKNYAKGYLRGIKSAFSTVAYKLIKERVRRKEVREKF